MLTQHGVIGINKNIMTNTNLQVAPVAGNNNRAGRG
jgi:hypothetical protein